MGNCLGYNRRDIDDLKIDHIREINFLKSIQYEETKALNDKIDKQQKEINLLNRQVLDLNQRCDQLMLDYYNLEQDYAKCKNQLRQCQGSLGSFRNIFSL